MEADSTFNTFAFNGAVTETQVTLEDLKIMSPFRLMITGPSGSGKSSFIFNLVKYRQDMFAEHFGRIIYCRPDADNTEHAKLFEEKLRTEFDNLEVVKDLPDVDSCLSGDRCLLILDDLSDKLFSSKAMLDLFTIYSHHANINVVFTAQNFYSDDRHRKLMVPQVNYHVLFSTPAEVSTMQLLSRKFTGRTRTLSSILDWIEDEFPDAGSNYLFVDFHLRSQRFKRFLKLRTAIFPRTSPMETQEIMPVLFLLDN